MPLTRYTDPVLEQSSVIARKPAHEVQPRISSFSNVPEAHRFLEKLLWQVPKIVGIGCLTNMVVQAQLPEAAPELLGKGAATNSGQTFRADQTRTPR